MNTSSGAFHCFFAHESFSVVSERAWGDVYGLQIWETVRREREAFIAKSNPKHLARDNQLSLRRECMPLYKNILREGYKHLA